MSQVDYYIQECNSAHRFSIMAKDANGPLAKAAPSDVSYVEYGEKQCPPPLTIIRENGRNMHEARSRPQSVGVFSLPPLARPTEFLLALARNCQQRPIVVARGRFAHPRCFVSSLVTTVPSPTTTIHLPHLLFGVLQVTASHDCMISSCCVVSVLPAYIMECLGKNRVNGRASGRGAKTTKRGTFLYYLCTVLGTVYLPYYMLMFLILTKQKVFESYALRAILGNAGVILLYLHRGFPADPAGVKV